jgi:chromosome segregation ATPase
MLTWLKLRRAIATQRRRIDQLERECAEWAERFAKLSQLAERAAASGERLAQDYDMERERVRAFRQFTQEQTTRLNQGAEERWRLKERIAELEARLHEREQEMSSRAAEQQALPFSAPADPRQLDIEDVLRGKQQQEGRGDGDSH